jgi:hypothetical protein
VAKGWGKLHNEELCDLYTPPNIIRFIKTRMVRWTGEMSHNSVGLQGLYQGSLYFFSFSTLHPLAVICPPLFV